MKKQLNEKKVYLYGRLSHEDEQSGDSNSIVNQRKILTKYAEENGFTNFEFIYDDGYSGADWERPSFNKMIEEVEKGNVSTIIVKDLSRFGRDYLRVGIYTEIVLPKHDVRLIAVHDNVDTERDDNDFAPMMNLYNEWFLKNTSKKIRAVWQDKGKRGERLAVIPTYGYRKSDDGTKRLVIDEESSTVVKRIFDMFKNGVGAAVIAKTLMEERILNPSAYKYEQGILSKPRKMKDPYFWNTTTIHKILDAEEYLGKTINFKTWSKSYKDNRSRATPIEKRFVFENTHQAIIDEQTWEVIRKMRKTKRRAPRYGNVGLFTGLTYCSDFGAKLYYLTRELKTKNATRYEGAYSCSEYRKATQYQEHRLCSCHYITEGNLSKIVLESLKNVLSFSEKDEKTFAKMIMENSEVQQRQVLEKKKAILKRKKKRIAELDMLFEKTYEDNAIGKLSDERFAKMSEEYEQEQKDVQKEIAELEQDISNQGSQLDNIEKFIELLRKYKNLMTLTPAITNEFIDRIIVHEPDKARGNRIQKVEIFYNGIGKLDINSLSA